MDLYEVVTKLAGPIRPIGDSHADAERFENLLSLLELMRELHAEVDTIATANKDRIEFSMARAGKECDRYLDELGIPKD